VSDRGVQPQATAELDEAWSRTAPARAAREILVCGVLAPLIAAYARREVVGAHRLDGLPAPVVFVANHSSHVDTPVLLRSLPARWRRRTIVAAAADYFYGSRAVAAAVSLAFATVPVRRALGTGGAGSPAHIGPLIEAGWSLLLFAEGTRSRDGRLGPMLPGAAGMAARHRVPIVPVHLSGTREMMPKGRNWLVGRPRLRRADRPTIAITIGAPIAVGPDDDRLQAMEEVRLFMADCGALTTPDPRLGLPREPAAHNRPQALEASD